MGRALLEAIAGDDRFSLAATSASKDDDLDILFSQSRVVLDFTAPGAVASHADATARTGTALLLGTTGLDQSAHEALAIAAKSAAILIAPNTSMGITLLIAQVCDAARQLGPAYSVEITDLHHSGKIDAPSGTALALAEAAAEGRGAEIGALLDQPNGISIVSRREGDAPGEHRVSFLGRDERIEYFHRAEGRALFAKGALSAALWLADQPPGLYGMADILAGEK